MTPMTLRLVARALEAAIPKLPKGAQSEMVGQHFKVYYGPNQLESLEILREKLPRVAALMASRGFPLRGEIQVLPNKLGGHRGKGRGKAGLYHPDYRAIEVDPGHISGEQMAVIVHELAHWQHDRVLSGGFNNAAIKDKYREALNAGRTKPQADLGTLVQRVSALRAEANLLFQHITTAKPGDVFQGQVEGKPAELRVLKVTRKDVRVRITRPTGASREDTMTMGEFSYASDPEGHVAQERKARALEAEANELASQMKGRSNEEVLTEGVSDWMPSDYARTNEKEWFAEMVAVAVVHPNLLIPAATEWLKDVW